MGELMEIGRFATASGLSVDALRHYAEVGVLKPAPVDPRTSYRRDSAAQPRDVRLACSLRGVDLPVDEVRQDVSAATIEHRGFQPQPVGKLISCAPSASAAAWRASTSSIINPRTKGYSDPALG